MLTKRTNNLETTESLVPETSIHNSSILSLDSPMREEKKAIADTVRIAQSNKIAGQTLQVD